MNEPLSALLWVAALLVMVGADIWFGVLFLERIAFYRRPSRVGLSALLLVITLLVTVEVFALHRLAYWLDGEQAQCCCEVKP